MFGPFAAVLTAPDTEQAVGARQRRALRARRRGVHPDLDAALAVADQLEAGLVRVNSPTSGVDFYAPFGGEKESGYGPREQGKAARDFYTSTHTITIAGSPA